MVGFAPSIIKSSRQEPISISFLKFGIFPSSTKRLVKRGSIPSTPKSSILSVKALFLNMKISPFKMFDSVLNLAPFLLNFNNFFRMPQPKESCSSFFKKQLFVVPVIYRLFRNAIYQYLHKKTRARYIATLLLSVSISFTKLDLTYLGSLSVIT